MTCYYLYIHVIVELWRIIIEACGSVSSDVMKSAGMGF